MMYHCHTFRKCIALHCMTYMIDYSGSAVPPGWYSCAKPVLLGTFRHTAIAVQCIALHCIALHCIALHCIALHCIALHCIALHCSLHHTTRHGTEAKYKCKATVLPVGQHCNSLRGFAVRITPSCLPVSSAAAFLNNVSHRLHS